MYYLRIQETLALNLKTLKLNILNSQLQRGNIFHIICVFKIYIGDVHGEQFKCFCLITNKQIPLLNCLKNIVQSNNSYQSLLNHNY